MNIIFGSGSGDRLRFIVNYSRRFSFDDVCCSVINLTRKNTRSFHRISPSDAKIINYNPTDPLKIPHLEFGLERVLFNPGVHFLQCPRTGVYNFDPSLKNIIQSSDFNFDLLREFVPASKDSFLLEKSIELKSKYISSTSSMSTPMSQLYFAIFGYAKGPILDNLSIHFKNEVLSFANLIKIPVSLIVEPRSASQVSSATPSQYSVVVEKTIVGEDETILMKMGNILEKKLTTPLKEFDLYRKKSSRSHRDKQEESYAFCKLNDILVRSQIDCADSRLPLRTFDIKTRACLPIRMNSENYKTHFPYKISSPHGLYNSFEREYYDMARSAFLKYNFQVRLGNMDGIFVAYHNVQEIFGFQYIPREELDRVLYGNSITANMVYSYILLLFNQIISNIVKNFAHSNEAFRVIFDTKRQKLMNIFVERFPKDQPFSEHGVPKSLEQYTLNLYAQINGIRSDSILLDPLGDDIFSLHYQINKCPHPTISEYLNAKKRIIVTKNSQDKIESMPMMREIVTKYLSTTADSKNQTDIKNYIQVVVGDWAKTPSSSNLQSLSPIKTS